MAELTFDGYSPWFRCQPPEVRETLRGVGLDPESVAGELERITESGGKGQDFKRKVLYRAFYHSSNPSTQAQIREHGLYDPKDDHGVVKQNRRSRDFAESNAARCESLDFAEDPGDELREVLGGGGDMGQVQALIKEEAAKIAQAMLAEKLQRIVAVFLSCPNAKIAAGGLAFAADLPALNGLGSQTEYASRIGVSKGAISKSTRFWKHLLDLPANSHMKSDDACQSYSDAQKTKHWRKKKVHHGTNCT